MYLYEAKFKDGIQDSLIKLVMNSGYAFSLMNFKLRITGEEIDYPIGCLHDAFQKGFMNEDDRVLDAEGFLSDLMGVQYKKHYENLGYVPKEGDLVLRVLSLQQYPSAFVQYNTHYQNKPLDLRVFTPTPGDV